MELYNKYRPKTFDEILGNDKAMKALKTALDHNVKTFLFVGDKGCSKTTSAECMANYLGCGEMNIRSINASDERKIEDIRAIGDELRYAPLDGGKRVYIFDECHGLTPDSQECLLRIVETAPDWAYFAFCTTNPEKLKEALKSRCTLINLKPLDDDTMLKLMRIVAHKEGIMVSLEVLQKAVSLSEGSGRNGLQILQSILYMETDEERMAYLESNNLSTDDPDVIQLCRSMMKREGFAKYMELYTQCEQQIKTKAESVRMMILGYAKTCLKRNPNNETAKMMLQSFCQADTFKNKDYAILFALVDFDQIVCANS